MNILSIVGLAITASVLAVLIKKYKPDQGIVISIAATVLIFSILIPKLQPAFSEISKLLSGANINNEYMTVLIKSLGVCFVAQLASDICRDANETAIATNVEMAGKIAVLLIALPLFGEIADLVVNLMK
jgi:stage III sporulation protein AD